MVTGCVSSRETRATEVIQVEAQKERDEEQ
jgi:hypothetical protein